MGLFVKSINAAFSSWIELEIWKDFRDNAFLKFGGLSFFHYVFELASPKEDRLGFNNLIHSLW